MNQGWPGGDYGNCGKASLKNMVKYTLPDYSTLTTTCFTGWDRCVGRLHPVPLDALGVPPALSPPPPQVQSDAPT